MANFWCWVVASLMLALYARAEVSDNLSEREKKLRVHCTLHNGNDDTRSFGEADYNKIHQQSEGIADSSNVAAGATDSSDTSSVQLIKATTSSVVLLGSTSDASKTMFFVEDSVFKMKAKATVVKQFSEESTDPPMAHTFDSSEDDSRPQPQTTSTNTPGINHLESQLDIQIRRTTNNSDAEGIVQTTDHVIAGTRDSKSAMSHTILTKNVIHVKTSSDVADREILLKANSSHVNESVKVPERINKLLSGGSMAQEENGPVNARTNLNSSRQQAISENFTQIAMAAKSLEDVIIVRSIRLPVQVNVSGFVEDVVILKNIERHTKTKVSGPLENIVIINSITIPAKDNVSKTSVENIDIINSNVLPTNFNVSESFSENIDINSITPPARGNISESVEDVTAISSIDVPVQDSVSEPMDNIANINSVNVSSNTSESDSLEVVVIHIAAPDRTTESNSRVDVENNTDEQVSTKAPSPQEKFVEQSTRPGLDVNSSNIDATSTSPTVPGVGEKDEVHSVATDTQVDADVIEIDGLDIPAIDYDSLSEEPNTEANVDIDESEPFARRMFKAPKRKTENGRYINGKYRQSV